MTKRDANEAGLFQDFSDRQGKIIRIDQLEDDLIIARLVTDGLREENAFLRSELARMELLLEAHNQARVETPLFTIQEHEIIDLTATSEEESSDDDTDTDSIGPASPALWM